MCEAIVEADALPGATSDLLRARITARGAHPRLLGSVGDCSASIGMWRARVRISPLFARASWREEDGHTVVHVEVSAVRIWVDLVCVLGIAALVGAAGAATGWLVVGGAVAIGLVAAAVMVTRAEVTCAGEQGRLLLGAVTDAFAGGG